MNSFQTALASAKERAAESGLRMYVDKVNWEGTVVYFSTEFGDSRTMVATVYPDGTVEDAPVQDKFAKVNHAE